MTLGTATHAYGEPSYWDHRYRQDPGPFDWYQKYNTLAPLFDLYIQRHQRALIIGCGNSALGEGMVADGYQDVVNIDISSVVIEAMQRKYQNNQKLKYVQMDARDMSNFVSDSFDVVVDKGTLDSLMCGSHAQENAKRMLEEVGRILKHKGVYILITYGDPSYRLHLLRDSSLWDINLHVIDRIERAPEQPTWELTKLVPVNADGSFATSILGANPEVHYIYVCIKDESKRLQDYEPVKCG